MAHDGWDPRCVPHRGSATWHHPARHPRPSGSLTQEPRTGSVWLPWTLRRGPRRPRRCISTTASTASSWRQGSPAATTSPWRSSNEPPPSCAPAQCSPPGSRTMRPAAVGGHHTVWPALLEVLVARHRGDREASRLSIDPDRVPTSAPWHQHVRRRSTGSQIASARFGLSRPARPTHISPPRSTSAARRPGTRCPTSSRSAAWPPAPRRRRWRSGTKAIRRREDGSPHGGGPGGSRASP